MHSTGRGPTREEVYWIGRITGEDWICVLLLEKIQDRIDIVSPNYRDVDSAQSHTDDDIYFRT
jgi:hypothetical protein